MSGNPEGNNRVQAPIGPDLLSGRTLFRVGLGLVIGALVYFLRYSIEQGWIGPLGQLGLAAAAGLTMVVVGDQISRSRPLYGNLLQGGGGAALYLTGFAAHHRSELLDSTTTIVLLGAVSAGILGMALRHRSEPLSLIGISGALAAPILLGDGYDPAVMLTVLAVGAALYLARGWRLAFGLGAVASGATLAIATLLPASPVTGTPAEVQLGLMGMLVGVWAVSMVVATRRSGSLYDSTVIPVITSVTIPLFTYAGSVQIWRDSLDRTERLAVAAALTAVVLATQVGLKRRGVPGFTADALWVPAVSVSTLALFGSFDLSLAVVLVTIEVAALLILGMRTGNLTLSGLGGAGMGLLMVTWPIRAALASDQRFDLEDVSTLAFVFAALATAALAPRGSGEPSNTVRPAAAGIGLLLALLWPLSSLQPIETGLVTAVWVALGLGLVVTGKIHDHQMGRNIGLGVTALAVGKLLLVDTAEVAPLGRVALFAGVGIALLVVGFWLGDDRTENGQDSPSAVEAV